MSTVYRFDASHSQFTVQAFAGGMLSFMGHNPTFAVRAFAGEFHWEPGADGGSLDITVPADALELMDEVRPSDRAEIENRMRQEVLEVATFPEVRFEAGDVGSQTLDKNRFALRFDGTMTVHGVPQRRTIDTELILYSDGVRILGEFPLRLSDHRIRPVTALAGAIKLQDQLRIVIDLAAWEVKP